MQSFNRLMFMLMLTLIFGIQATESPHPLPPGPGERLKRPGLIGFSYSKSHVMCPPEAVNFLGLPLTEVFPRFSTGSIVSQLSKCLKFMTFSGGMFCHPQLNESTYVKLLRLLLSLILQKMKEDNISQSGDYDAPFCEQQCTHGSNISLFKLKSFDQLIPQTASF